MKLTVRDGSCKGYGYCADVAPGVYELDSSGYNDLAGGPAREVAGELDAEALAGLEACPVRAIRANGGAAEMQAGDADRGSAPGRDL